MQALKADLDRRDQEYKARQLSKAHYFWRISIPIQGTIAECYLREARAIRRRLPQTLRFLPATKDGYHPAMIGAYGFPNEPEPGTLSIEASKIKGVQLTLLGPDGSGKAKTGDGKSKITIGESIGTPVVVASPNDLLGLAIAEGIEDALSTHESMGVGAWSAGGCSRMPTLAVSVPEYIEFVIIAADADPDGLKYARLLNQNLSQRGVDNKVVVVSEVVRGMALAA